MKMTNEERQALIDYCNTRIAECATYAKARKVMEIAPAALTAEPVKVPNEPTGGDAPCHRMSMRDTAGLLVPAGCVEKYLAA